MSEYDNGWKDSENFQRDRRREPAGSISYSLGFAILLLSLMSLFAILLVAYSNHWTIPNHHMRLWWFIVTEIIAIAASAILFCRGSRLNREQRDAMKEKWGDRW